MLEKISPLLFALLWSTGFPMATMGMQYAEPMTYLCMRMSIVVLLLLPILLYQHRHHHFNIRDFMHCSLVGLLLHGVYLGGVFGAVSYGLKGAVAALIVSLQPIIVSILAYFVLSETLTKKYIIGLILGLVGVVIVLWDNIDITPMQQGNAPNNHLYYAYALCFISLTAIIWATLHQKKYATALKPLPSFLGQYVAAAVFFGLMSAFFETQTIQFEFGFFISMIWLVFVLSLGAIGLWMYLMKRNQVAKVSSLLYLVPIFSVIEGWVLFNQTFNSIALLGMVITMAGVSLVVRR